MELFKKQAPRPFKTEKGKLYAILSYCFCLWLLGMFSKQEQKDLKVRFHVTQGMVLFTFIITLHFITILIEQYNILPSYILLGLKAVVFTYFVGMMVYGAYNAYKEQEKKLPFVGWFMRFLIKG